MRLLRARGSAEHGKVTSGSATLGLWLGDRKVGSHVIGEDRSRLPGRGTVGELRRKGRRASDRTEKAHRLRFRFRRERRASRLPCLSLGLGDDRRSTSESGDVSLTIFITSVSGSESLTSFTNRFIHFTTPDHQALGGRLIRPKGMEDLASFSVRKVKRVAAEERNEYSSAQGQ